MLQIKTFTIAAWICLFLLPVSSQAALVADFTINPNPAVIGETVEFDSSPSQETDPSRVLLNEFLWDVDNDGNWDFNAPILNYIFGAPGDYQINLRIRNDIGQTAVASKILTVTVTAVPLPAGFWLFGFALGGISFVKRRGNKNA